MQSRRPRGKVLVASKPTRAQLAAMVDHTLLKPEATEADVTALVTEAAELGVYAVCVSPSMVPVAVRTGGVRVASVAGFPSGKHVSSVKAHEAERAVASGAAEVDMVIDIGAALAGDIDAVRADIAAVRAAMNAVDAGSVLKVIVESAVLFSGTDDSTLVRVCRAAEDAGADFVKTSTGFHPAGGASVRAVTVMSQTVGGRLGVKASGGIRAVADALAMLDAGATRLGLSGTRAVLDGLD
ncbi:deoxyribose-phosphate aldolase [Mycobacterium scrofulaceum]|nr:deoxyribose-phosphate aldolase [Mycobacterium scrofulaceum]